MLDTQSRDPEYLAMITGMEHVALSVANLDRSIAFYSATLGMKVLRVIESGPEMPLGRIAGMAGATARIAHLESNGMMLELFEYTSPRGEPVSPDRRQADHGFIHIGFTSTDALADYKALCDQGVHFLSDPVEYRPGVWVVYFSGPDGEVCELRQT